MSKIETLHTCPTCHTPGFTARGLKAHKCDGKNRAANSSKDDLPESSEVAACAARFRALHGALRHSVLGSKLLKYFLGLESSRLYELHAELYGETRGGDQAQGQNGKPSVLLEPWLEEHLGVTARSARTYRDFFRGLTTTIEHADTIKKLNDWWQDWKEKTTPQLAESPAKKGRQTLSLKEASAASLSLHEGCKLSEKDLQTILDHPDEWGLHELFEVPAKDVTPTDDDTSPPEPPDNKDKLIKFWASDFARRITRKEYMRLPKAQRETLATDLEEVVHELKDSLQPKKPKAKA